MESLACPVLCAAVFWTPTLRGVVGHQRSWSLPCTGPLPVVSEPNLGVPQANAEAY